MQLQGRKHAPKQLTQSRKGKTLSFKDYPLQKKAGHRKAAQGSYYKGHAFKKNRSRLRYQRDKCLES